MKEIWKTIPKYPNYQISNLGRVRSKYSDKILKLTITRYGYVTVILYKNKKAYYNRVHRLVALAFIPNPKKTSYYKS